MKHYHKAPSSYFKKRCQFQSPQCSTVVEVNPSCESQQSMLERIIYPEHREQQKKFYHQGEQKRMALLQRNQNMELNSKYRFDEKYGKKNTGNELRREEIIDQVELYRTVERERRNEELEVKYERKLMQNDAKIKYNNQKENYSPCMRLDSMPSASSLHKLIDDQANRGARTYNMPSQLANNYNEPPIYYPQSRNPQSLIDEQKLQKIQQKIRRHQQKQYQSEQPYQQNRKNSLKDPMESQMQKIQLEFGYPPKINKKLKLVEKVTTEKKDNINRNQTHFGKNIGDRETDKQLNRLKKCFQNIYSTILFTPKLPLSPQNINLKNLQVEQIKLIFGPIFAEVTIRQKKISLNEFIDKALQIAKSYNQKQVERILNLFVNVNINVNENIRDFGSAQEIKTFDSSIRMPGKLLKNSKTDRHMQNQKSQRNLRDQSAYSSNRCQTNSKPLSNKPLLSYNAPYMTQQKVSKMVYMQRAQSVQSDQGYHHRINYPDYEQKINMKKNTLQMMLSEEKQKRRYVSMHHKQKVIDNNMLRGNDEELERLNNLEKKFNEHFSLRE